MPRHSSAQRKTNLARARCVLYMRQGIKAPAPLAVPPVVGYRLYIVTNQLSLTHTHPGMYVDAARYDMMLLLLPRVESVHVWGQRDAQGLSRVARYAECVLYIMCSLRKRDAQDIRVDADARPFRVFDVDGLDSFSLPLYLPPSLPNSLPQWTKESVDFEPAAPPTHPLFHVRCRDACA